MFDSDLVTAQKMKFSIKNFFSVCDQIRRKLGNWSHLLKWIMHWIMPLITWIWNDTFAKAELDIREKAENEQTQ